MERVLKPAHLDVDPSSPTAAKEWRHWHRTFVNFIEECERLYVKIPNEIFARHLLATRQQKPGESLDEFMRELRKLSKDCNLKAVSADQYREELIQDTFINGLSSAHIHQRLLENNMLDLQGAYNQAASLDLAQRNAEAYASLTAHTAVTVTPQNPLTSQVLHSTAVVNLKSSEEDAMHSSPDASEKSAVATFYNVRKKCYFCGGPYHARSTCPAREATCHKCSKKGHFARVCQSKSTKASIATVFISHIMTTVTNVPHGLSQAATVVTVKGKKLSALIDSYSTESYISEKVVQELELKVHPSSKGISMAQKSLNTSSPGYVVADLMLGLDNQSYPDTHLGVLRDLCADIILGLDFQRQHLSVTFEFGGHKSQLILKNSNNLCSYSCSTRGTITLS
ncbi:uncharacterized protein LOC135213780 [Macrobrachium nipponense]|uniref:uncharacterized protein LOC135213780 n=1 Tax=Macrobrachium nipponense TaxID=159736 RepID=UPI0030C851C6